MFLQFHPKKSIKNKIVKNTRLKGKKCQQITQKKTGDLCQNNTHRIPDRKTPITKIKIKISKNSQLKE